MRAFGGKGQDAAASGLCLKVSRTSGGPGVLGAAEPCWRRSEQYAGANLGFRHPSGPAARQGPAERRNLWYTQV